MSSELSNSSRRLIFGAAIIALFLSYAGQRRYDTWRFYSPPLLQTTLNLYIEPQPLSPQVAEAASFGNKEFLADWYWLSLIQYYGGGDPSGHYRKLAELFDTVTSLSPKFTSAYVDGLLVLPGEGFSDQALALGAKGEQNLPDEWQLPYYRGLVYHIYKKDYVAAAQEFQKAAALKNAPPITRLFAAIYYNQANQRQTAYLIFKTVADTSTDSFVKDRAEKYVQHLDILFALQDADTAFQTKFHRAPQNLQELVVRGFISQIPESPLHISFTLNSNGQVIEAEK